jgi:serine/threonine protein kinase/DNA-binding winged helix-turn-helix (wHTH) protein
MPSALSDRARFASFELDVRAGELCGNGRTVLLPEQQFQVLRMVLERAGTIVTREEIKRKLWPNDTVVEFDSGINSVIKNLRGALGDSADAPRYIETLARRGYRLMVPVEWVGAAESAAADSAEESPAEPSSDASESDASAEADSEALPKAKLKVGRLTGKVVSHYRVLEVIGGGGMGLVYRAEDLKLGRAVALKFLPEEVGDDPMARERFDREAHAVSALNHANICTVYDFDEHEGYPFIAMELLQGKTLREHLADNRFRLTQPEGPEVAIQIASGLEAAHEKGIIHRDIKPANIFITEKNVAKILDFGVAKILEDPNAPGLAKSSSSAEGELRSGDCEVSPGCSAAEPRVDGSISEERGDRSPAGSIPAQSVSEAGDGTAESVPLQSPGLKPGEEDDRKRWTEARLFHRKETTLTRTGVKLGTAGYMSPEQVRGESLDARTDIFSFGLVLYEMATGERAFTGETEAILHDAIQHRDPKPIREMAPEITPSLEKVIGHSLEKERSKRYQSVAELRDALARERVQAPLVPPENRPEPDKAPHPRRRFAVSLAAALLLVTLTGVFYRLTHPRFKLTDKDTIVLAEFENQTGDPVFDGSLVWALRIGLEQTPFLNVLAPDKVARVLSQIGHSQEPLTPERALEVCRKTNSRAVLVASIADAGNQYNVSLRAVRCDTGAVAARSEATANERNQIVTQLGRAAADLRRSLGEPTATVQSFNQPLEKATSPSVEALKLYTETEKRTNQKGDTTGIADMLLVTEKDPSFALAYRRLGVYYGNVGEWFAMRENYTKAFHLRQQLTNRERLRVEGTYYFYVTGEWERGVAVWQETSQQISRRRNGSKRCCGWLARPRAI